MVLLITTWHREKFHQSEFWTDNDILRLSYKPGSYKIQSLLVGGAQCITLVLAMCTTLKQKHKLMKLWCTHNLKAYGPWRFSFSFMALHTHTSACSVLQCQHVHNYLDVPVRTTFTQIHSAFISSTLFMLTGKSEAGYPKGFSSF